MKWINIKDKKPEEGQRCLVEMKHAIVEATYKDDGEELFSVYMWRDIEFYANKWMPLETFTEWAEGTNQK